MSSTTTTTTHQRSSKHQASTHQHPKANRSKQSKKALLHYPVEPMAPDDWVLFPDEIIAGKHSSIRHQKTYVHEMTRSARRQRLSPSNHVIDHKAAMPARPKGRRTPETYRPSTCLEHMSARNCTAACLDRKSLPALPVPPKAPSPQRLMTPDLSDLEEDDFWSCGRSFEDNESVTSMQSSDDFWNEMEKKVAKAIVWQQKGRKEPEISFRSTKR